jgi:hypothetical protein
VRADRGGGPEERASDEQAEPRRGYDRGQPRSFCDVREEDGDRDHDPAERPKDGERVRVAVAGTVALLSDARDAAPLDVEPPRDEPEHEHACSRHQDDEFQQGQRVDREAAA